MRVQDVLRERRPDEPALRRGLPVALTAGARSLFAWLLVTFVTLVLWALGVTTA